MNEFEVISKYFKHLSPEQKGVIIGPGDDAACLQLPPNHLLLVSTDTLVANRHFLTSWDAYDIAYKAIMVNVSDIAAMTVKPLWLTMSLTLPEIQEIWIEKFSLGMKNALEICGVSLVGGDLTKGPLTINVTIHGSAPKKLITLRSGAKPGDVIYVSGRLGGPSLAVKSIQENQSEDKVQKELVTLLKNPQPRIDLTNLLQKYATSSIDISDGLSSDLKHICDASHVGALIQESAIPVHPLVQAKEPAQAIQYALDGGDEYELCFTVPALKEKAFLAELSKWNKSCYKIGLITEETDYLILRHDGSYEKIEVNGYNHFK